MHPDADSKIESIAASVVEVRRGGIVESRHRGHVATVDPSGQIVASLGAPQTVTYLRSSAKPFQAIPLVASGAADHFGFTDLEIALACGSHNGEEIHVQTVSRMLEKIGLTPTALKCGIHPPFSEAVVNELRARGEQPTVLHNNCSGKHAGMLAVARHINAPTAAYDHLSNPVQAQIAQTISQFAGVTLESLATGVDGCGAPIFGVSVSSMALMYARLVDPPKDAALEIRRACARIIKAMMDYPEMVGGRAERLDTKIMEALPHRIVSKVGAEGVYTAGIISSDLWPNALGLAIKIEDGDNLRARAAVVIESLRQLGILSKEALALLKPYSSFEIRNHNGDLVGEVEPSFNLRVGNSE